MRRINPDMIRIAVLPALTYPRAACPTTPETEKERRRIMKRNCATDHWCRPRRPVGRSLIESIENPAAGTDAPPTTNLFS